MVDDGSRERRPLTFLRRGLYCPCLCRQKRWIIEDLSARPELIWLVVVVERFKLCWREDGVEWGYVIFKGEAPSPRFYWVGCQELPFNEEGGNEPLDWLMLCNKLLGVS